MWLRRRLGTAQRGREQLDRKLRILIPELQRQRREAEQCHERWTGAYEEANTWLRRASLLGGQAALRNATAPQLAEVDIVWTTAMGLSYPIDATMDPLIVPALTLAGNAGIVPATNAFRDALLAAIRTAAAEEAVRKVEAEIAVTRRRLRALEKRWLPWLQEALAELELSLEQTELEDGIRLRRLT